MKTAPKDTPVKSCPVIPGSGGGGYPQTDVKTSGIKVRGTGAATKGTKARGPMA